MTLRRLACPVLLATLAIAAAPASSSAATSVAVADQDLNTFNDPAFSALGIKRTRVLTPWNVALKPRDRAFLDQYLRTARGSGVEPLVHFSVATGSRCPKRPCQLPSVSAYKKAFRAFRKRWPFVKVVGAWNEANHRSQPTFKNPKRAAQYYNVVRKYCRGCKIVAADVLDDPNMVRWLKVFKKTAHGARIWGLHNYRDVNRRKGQLVGGTSRLLRNTHGQVWLTETGGIVKFVLPSGGTLFRYDEARANRSIGLMFRIAKRYRRRIKRLYVYHWKVNNPSNRFDAGLLRADGSPRPGYFTFAKNLRTRFFNP